MRAGGRLLCLADAAQQQLRGTAARSLRGLSAEAVGGGSGTPPSGANDGPRFFEEGYYGNPDTERIRREIERPENTVQSGPFAGMHRPGDYVVRELDEQGRKVGAVGPDPDAPRGPIWHKMSIEHAMQASGTAPPSDDPSRGMDRRSPGGPVAEGLDDLRPTRPDDGHSMRDDPGAHVRQRVKEVASGVWETLKHGVNNAGQPQIVEELKGVSPETDDETAALRQPRSTASRGQTDDSK
ncbi:hypothetical protein TSOC_008685 [Tetrabaena socialis]|uniref:Uncharacterized protein n=1 Tax=Tetrabaena socialis TaxID=47790 RepID=A0A2J7ZXU6_9CHLO|nr:hypothetical protein TSOC_008685 [Tetrabaena socialis]|eukprot:PNH05093.1 hypothetical protein TSOC_008685 [Tetrabaena socialis]